MPYKDKEKQKAFQKVWKRTRTSKYSELKDKPCTDCGNRFHFSAMDWDHVVGKKKRILSKMTSYSEKNVFKEIVKCELVCANCHRIRTYNRIMENIAGTQGGTSGS
jgi:hypothetical protein